MSRAKNDRPLPPGLSWAPAPALGAKAAEAPASHESACYFGLSDVAAEDFQKGGYQVMHYAPAAYGMAYGPLSLGQVVRFCQDLTARLQLYERVVFQHGPTVAERANCAVLLGAFLVLCKGWSANMVAEALRSEAKLKFVCAWASPKKVQTPVMYVKDCWDGLELAGSRGWLRIGAWQVAGREDCHLEAQLVDLGVSQYSRLVLEYDACWLVPSEVLVMADPVTTIKDPNPSTCPSFGPPAETPTEQGEEDEDLEPNSPVSEGDMWLEDLEATSPVLAEEPARQPSTSAPHLALLTPEPEEDPRRSSHVSADPEEVAAKPSFERKESFRSSQKGSKTRKWDGTSTCGTILEPGSLDSNCVGDFAMPEGINDEEDRNTSLHSVCKIYQDGATLSPEEISRPKALDFISLLRKHGVGVVVRTNASNEDGLREIGGSYDPVALIKQSIHHLDFFVKDVHGGIPPPQLIRSFLLEVDSIAPRCETSGSQVFPASAESPPSARPIPASGGSQRSVASGEAHLPAVVVHCKSGFGRSVLFACLLVIHRYDVPGRALLGWARMVRPGAFTVPEQERFLCSFGGREDLHRHVGLADSAPCKCCSVQ